MPLTEAVPGKVKKVVGELTPDDDRQYAATTFNEYVELRRIEAILKVWEEQAPHERELRAKTNAWVWRIIAGQTGLLFVFLFAALIWPNQISADLAKVVVTAVCAETVGLGFVISRYLFSANSRLNLDKLVEGASRGRSSSADVASEAKTNAAQSD